MAHGLEQLEGGGFLPRQRDCPLSEVPAYKKLPPKRAAAGTALWIFVFIHLDKQLVKMFLLGFALGGDKLVAF